MAPSQESRKADQIKMPKTLESLELGTLDLKYPIKKKKCASIASGGGGSAWKNLLQESELHKYYCSILKHLYY